MSTRAGNGGLLSPTAMGVANRSRVLELLHQNGPSSRAQLARALNVNRATVASILQPLIEDATLVEGELLPTSPVGGKPGRPLWFNRHGTELGSLRIGSQAVTAARLGMDGTMHAREHATIDPQSGLEAIEAQILAVAERAFGARPLLGIGVAAAGMIDTESGTVLSFHLAPALNQYPIGPVLSKRFGVPTSVDHHPRVQALGDKWFGGGRHLRSFASLYTGEALGVGIVHEGQLISGPQGAGGEYGHVVVDLNGTLCLCGRRGCWETVATLLWLRRAADHRGMDGAATLDCATLVDQARTVPDAADLLDQYAHNLAVGMANNEQMLASGVYIVHGDAAAGGEPMRERLQHWLDVFSPHRGNPTVVLGDSADDITLLGGGGLVLTSRLGDQARH